MMKAGELDKRIDVLSLALDNDTYSWVEKITVWAKVERLDGNNIFSSVGIGAKSVKFTIRKRDLSLYDAIRWDGRHCFLTDVVEVDRACIEVTAALVEPKTCTVERTEIVRGALNRPVSTIISRIVFPGCLIEKYLRSNQDKPMTVTELRYILVAPKVIQLGEGEVVGIEDVFYEVLLLHTLDEYKNEYEIRVRSEP